MCAIFRHDAHASATLAEPVHPLPGPRKNCAPSPISSEGSRQCCSRVFADPKARRTVVVIPSMSLDHEELAKLRGASRYEERFLCLLMLLQLPATPVVYITSEPVAASIVDYYLGLDARRRPARRTCRA